VVRFRFLPNCKPLARGRRHNLRNDGLDLPFDTTALVPLLLAPQVGTGRISSLRAQKASFRELDVLNGGRDRRQKV
jgi:hypothetical protein